MLISFQRCALCGCARRQDIVINVISGRLYIYVLNVQLKMSFVLVYLSDPRSWFVRKVDVVDMLLSVHPMSDCQCSWFHQ